MKYFSGIRKENIIYLFIKSVLIYIFILYFDNFDNFEYLCINENVKESELNSIHNSITFFKIIPIIIEY